MVGCCALFKMFKDLSLAKNLKDECPILDYEPPSLWRTRWMSGSSRRSSTLPTALSSYLQTSSCPPSWKTTCLARHWSRRPLSRSGRGVAAPSQMPPVSQPSGGDTSAGNSVFYRQDLCWQKARNMLTLSTTVLFLFHLSGLFSYTPCTFVNAINFIQGHPWF